MQPPPPKMSRLQLWALRLNRRQTRALAAGFAVCLFFAVRPYWYFSVTNELGGRMRAPGEFAFLATPPVYQSQFAHGEARIDWLVFLAIEVLCIGTTVAAIAALRDKNNEANATYGQYR